MEGSEEILYLRRRVRELEEKVAQLRLSRRVLMNLLERLEKEKWQFWIRLEKENKRLHRVNYNYAKRLMHKNKRIVELEAQLNQYKSGNSVN